MLARLIELYRVRFEEYGGAKTRASFKGELNYQSGKLFYLMFIAALFWLPYIPYDLELHSHPAVAVAARTAFSLIAAALILLRFTKRFRSRPNIPLTLMVVSHYVLTAVVAGTAGAEAPEYIGGMTFVLLLPVFVPFSVKLKYALPVFAVALFFILGALTGIDFSSRPVRYALNDMLVAFAMSFFLAHTIHDLRRKAWHRRHKLENMVAQNMRNLNTIAELARKSDEENRNKSRFLATMSHEIRTPMNAIIGVTLIELQKKGLPESYAAALEKIHSSGSLLLGIINDILDMSKIETGKLRLVPADYDTPSLINDAVQINVVRIGSKPIEFKLDIDKNLPLKLRGDELRLKQVLNNLLSNAVKYTSKGYVKLSVGYAESGGGVRLRFAVSDTGQGMKPEDRARLFSRYLRFNAEANRAIEGTGLGLSIARKLVEMMDGTIEVESEYGKGSVFTVTVKQDAVPDCSVPIGAELAERLRNFTFAGAKINAQLRIVREPMPYGSVLVVDDVDTNLYVAEGLLLPYNLKVEGAGSGFAAVEKVKGGKVYDIIFMDHMMPEMDGVETARQLRALGYEGVIVALTANAIVGSDKFFARKGFDGFISKPIDIRRLDETLKKFVRDRHPEEAGQFGLGGAAFADRAASTFDMRVDTPPREKSIDPKLAKVFCRDAKDAIVSLREMAASGALKLFTIKAHAMKSALVSVGEGAASKQALALEEAGRGGDTEFISVNTERFIETLEALIKKLSLAADGGNVGGAGADAAARGDGAYRSEQLRAVIAACKDFDDAAAYAALDRLKAKAWSAEVTDTLEKIREALYLHSDFDGAGELARGLSES